MSIFDSFSSALLPLMETANKEGKVQLHRVKHGKQCGNKLVYCRAGVRRESRQTKHRGEVTGGTCVTFDGAW